MIPAKYSNQPYYPAVKFTVVFISLFLLFYYFNIGFFGLTSPGRHYIPFLARHVNYIHWLRRGLLSSSAALLNRLGFATIFDEYHLLVAGRGSIQLVYSCLGLGVMSFFAAFVLAYPKHGNLKYWFLAIGLVVIQLLNIARFVLLALYWRGHTHQIADHHTIFNLIIYVLVTISLYFWVKSSAPTAPVNEN